MFIRPLVACRKQYPHHLEKPGLHSYVVGLGRYYFNGSTTDAKSPNLTIRGIMYLKIQRSHVCNESAREKDDQTFDLYQLRGGIPKCESLLL